MVLKNSLILNAIKIDLLLRELIYANFGRLLRSATHGHILLIPTTLWKETFHCY